MIVEGMAKEGLWGWRDWAEDFNSALEELKARHGKVAVRAFVFWGTPREGGEGFPKVVNQYDTVNHGTLKVFKIGASEVTADGARWIRKYLRIYRGSPHDPGLLQAIYVAQGGAA